jgi:hypothetical protein
MYMILTRSLVLSVLLIVGLFSLSPNVFAQSGAGITLIPSTIEEAANPGDVLDRSLKVTNESEEDKEYYIYKRDIRGVETGGVPLFAEDGAEVTGFEMSEWVSFESDRIMVKAGESQNIPLKITIPGDATPGSHFGGIFVSVEPPRLRQTGAGVGYEIASIISIRINGDVMDTARIRAFSTNKLVYSSKDVTFISKIENQGNIMIRPHGPLTITSSFGGKPEVILVNESLAGVFPGTTRDIETAWNVEGLGFGKYEAVVALSYDGANGQKTIDATTVFWVFPMKIMLSVIGGFIGVFVLGYALTKYYIRQAVMRASGGRRVVSQRYRRQTGISRLMFVFASILTVLVIILIILIIMLMLFA